MIHHLQRFRLRHIVKKEKSKNGASFIEAFFMDKKETIISTITGPHSGAVSLFRISGPQAFSITDKCFKNKNLSKQKGATIHYGKFTYKGKVLDDVLVYLFKKPNSYTGEDVIELSCHNNRFIIEEIYKAYIEEGCRIAQPGEFTERAFLNGKLDLSQAEAVSNLINAHSLQSTQYILKNLEGSLSNQINLFSEELIEIASLIELELDFSEEDVEFVSRETILNKLKNIKKLINNLISSFSYGKKINNPITVVLAGKPNVGKSSIMNRILNKERVIVTDIPGTTRDLVHENITINNHEIKIIDSAGIRESTDIVENIGITKSLNTINEADILVYILDNSEPISKEDYKFIDQIKKGKGLLIINKSDLSTHKEITELKNQNDNIIEINTIDNVNFYPFMKAIETYINSNFNKDEKYDIVITSERQYHILKKADDIIDNIIKKFNHIESGEFLSMDIRFLIDKLFEITGKITTDDILNNIFSKFCIGK